MARLSRARYIAAMPNLLYVLIGGAAGAGLRYEVGRLTPRHLGPGFPWGTLTVNLLGGLLMGALVGAMASQDMTDRPPWLLLGLGVLGGFTTFSAFSFDMFALLERGQPWIAAGYAVLSVIGSLAPLFAGYGLARAT